jgi:hypothetical protein
LKKLPDWPARMSPTKIPRRFVRPRTKAANCAALRAGRENACRRRLRLRLALRARQQTGRRSHRSQSQQIRSRHRRRNRRRQRHRAPRSQRNWRICASCQAHRQRRQGAQGSRPEGKGGAGIAASASSSTPLSNDVPTTRSMSSPRASARATSCAIDVRDRPVFLAASSIKADLCPDFGL